MSKYVNLVLKAGLGFGVVFGLLSYLMTERPVSSLVAGFIFGSLLVLSNVRREKHLLAKGFETGTMRPVQVRELLVPGTPERAFAAAWNALQAIRNVAKIEPNSTSGSIRAMVGISFKSSGEELLVSVSETDAGNLVSIKSEPMLPLFVFDGGKGVENVEVFAQYLLERGASRRVAQGSSQACFGKPATAC